MQEVQPLQIDQDLKAEDKELKYQKKTNHQEIWVAKITLKLND